MEPSSSVTWAEVALAVLPALVAAVLAGLVGWLAGRGRERREMRRQAYVEWLRAARNMIVLPPGEPAPTGEIHLPHPKRIQELNHMTVELQIVASDRVAMEAAKFLDFVTGPELPQHMEGRSYHDMGEATDHFGEVTKPYIKAVVDAMRGGLRAKR